MTKPKVVFDTNIYLSAIIFGGNPRRVVQLAVDNKIILYSSAEILLEIALKLKDKFKWSTEEINFTIKAIGDLVKIVGRDPSDNKILEAALKAKADFIVTGDNHLLKLKNFKGIKIIQASDL